MADFRKGMSIVTIHRLRPLISLKDWSDALFGDGPPKRWDQDCYAFRLELFHIGEEPFAAVTCDGIVVVYPFHWPGLENLPLRPEDIPDV